MIGNNRTIETGFSVKSRRSIFVLEALAIKKAATPPASTVTAPIPDPLTMDKIGAMPRNAINKPNALTR